MAVRHGSSRSLWNTIAILPRNESKSAKGSRPLTRTVPAVGSVSTAIMVEDRRLAAAGLAEDRQHLAGANVEGEAIHRTIGRAGAGLAEHLADMVEVNGRLGRRDGIPHIARSDTAR